MDRGDSRRCVMHHMAAARRYTLAASNARMRTRLCEGVCRKVVAYLLAGNGLASGEAFNTVLKVSLMRDELATMMSPD